MSGDVVKKWCDDTAADVRRINEAWRRKRSRQLLRRWKRFYERLDQAGLELLGPDVEAKARRLFSDTQDLLAEDKETT